MEYRMQNLIQPPHAVDWLKPQFSVVQSFDISTLFFNYLYPSLEAKFPEMSEDDVTVYEIFTCVCKGFETSAEWNKAIYRLKKIRKDDQTNIKLSPCDVFLCSIELCKIHSARFEEGSYSYLIHLLEDMHHYPENHFWSPSYCAVSCGGAPLEIVKKYHRKPKVSAKRKPYKTISTIYRKTKR